MLNDQLRNLSFREAIVKKLKRGFRTVLDIGTGTGILSLFAMEGGADEIYACDSSSAMTAIASEVFDHHDAAVVNLMNKHSTELVIPDDINQRVSLVVCEIVDCGLLGEHVLETLVHAWEHLLEPNGVVLPLAAALHICGVHSEDIAQSWILRNFPADLGLENFKIRAMRDSYDTEKLSRLPKGYRILTDVVTPLTIDFNDAEEMREILAGNRDKIITLVVNDVGTIDCIAGWFTLRIDEDIALQTGPESPITSWEQAVFPNSQPLPVRPGQEIQVTLSFKLGKLSLNVEQSEESDKRTVYASQSIIKLFNNRKWTNALQTAASYISKLEKNLRILDLTSFPIFGFTVLKAGHKGDQLVCGSFTDGDEELINSVASGLGIQKQVLCMPEGVIDGLVEQKTKFDVILLPIVEETGELSERILSRLPLFRDCLNNEGLLLPHSLQTIGQFVESEWLHGVSRVLNCSVTCGYDIAPFINKYSAEQQIDFRLDAIDKIARSKPFKLLNLNLDSCEETMNRETTATICTPGSINAMVYWHQIDILDDPPVVVSTLDDESHINQCAQLINANADNNLNIVVYYDNGLIGVRLKENG